MLGSRLLQRSAAVGLLLAVLAAAAGTAWEWAEAYADGQREIADKSDQLRSLRELATARTGFDRLTRKGGKGVPVLLPDGNPQEALSVAIGQAVENQEVVLDGVEALPAEPALTLAAVRLRGTQLGVHAFLRQIEERTPYLTVERLDLSLFRPADTERHKPLVLSADVRVAAVTAPAAPSRSALAPESP